jgi:site-specific recombinase XerC
VPNYFDFEIVLSEVNADGRPRNRVRIRPEIAKGGRAGDVFLPDAVVAKLARFWVHKATRREGTGSHDPLFCNQSRRRISKRRVQFAGRTWQIKAGFDRHDLYEGSIPAAATTDGCG